MPATPLKTLKTQPSGKAGEASASAAGHRTLQSQLPTSAATSRSGGSQARTATRRRGELESRIGAKLFNWIGVLAICLGVGFFLKLAFDRAWIGPWGRIAIGVAIGLGFLIGAERLRKRYPSYAYGLTGGGILLLYLTFFAANSRYQKIDQPVAFVLMALVTATASLLAARYHALPIAILGLIGGFLTPILLSTGADNEVGLFGYIALLDLGVLALAYSKHWRVLNYLAFSATVAMVIGWMLTFWETEKLWTTVIFLTIFFTIFALVAVLYNVVNRQPTRWLDLALVFINALLYFGSTYELLEDDHHKYLGLFAVLVSGFYLILGYFTYRRDRLDRLLIYTFIGLAFLFAVLAVPIQLDHYWVTMGWAIEGAIMTWIGLRTDDRTSRYAALAVFVIGVSHWALIDMSQFAYNGGDVFTPLMNRRAASCGVLVAALAAAAWFYKRYSEAATDERTMFRSLYLLGANALSVVLLSLDANDYFEQAKALAAGAGREVLAHIANDQQMTLTVLWSVYGGAALVVGIVRGLKPLRYAALLLLGLGTLKVIAIDLPYYDSSWHRLPLLNQTFAAFAGLIVAMGLAAWFYKRSTQVNEEERSVLLPLLIGSANILALIALSAEALGHFERAAGAAGQGVTNLASLENTKQLALSVVWIGYAATTLAIGIARGRRGLRVGALILLGLATVKVLGYDLRFYRAEWHTTIFNQSFAAFALLILALAIGAWLYSRRPAADIQERAFVVPLLVGVANILGVIALSAEAIGHFERAKGSGGAPVGLENTKQLVLTALWSVHGAAALLSGISRKSRSLRWGALALLAIAILKVLAVDLTFYRDPEHTFIFNQSFGAFALVISALATGVWYYGRDDSAGESERYAVVRMLTATANLLAVIGLSAEILGYYDRSKALAAAGRVNVSAQSLENSAQFWLSALWSVYGGTALTLGIKRKNRGLRWGGIILLAIAIGKLLVVDVTYYDAEFHRLIFNQTFGAFAIVIAVLACAVWLYSRSDETEVDERGVLTPVTMAIANVLAIIGLSAEASGYFKAQMETGGLLAETFRDLKLAQQLSLSVIWTIYGGILLTTGILRRNRLLRMMALVLLSVTIVKVFFLDLSSLDRVYRIISFIVLGAILLAVSFLYQRFRQRWFEGAEAADAAPEG